MEKMACVDRFVHKCNLLLPFIFVVFLQFSVLWTSFSGHHGDIMAIKYFWKAICMGSNNLFCIGDFGQGVCGMYTIHTYRKKIFCKKIFPRVKKVE